MMMYSPCVLNTDHRHVGQHACWVQLVFEQRPCWHPVCVWQTAQHMGWWHAVAAV